MCQRKLQIMVKKDVSDLDVLLQRDCDLLLNKVLKSEEASLLRKHLEKGTLNLYIWENHKKGTDGLTEVDYRLKKKNFQKYVNIYIEENVLQSGSVCWRLGVLLHELGHAIHFFSPKVTRKRPVKPVDHHGECWKNVLEKAVKRGNLKICSILETSPEEGCQFKDVCQWCVPHSSVMTMEWPLIPEESPYGGVCMFCDTKAIRPLPHIRKNIDCMNKYVNKYGLGYKTFVQIMHAKLRRRKKRTSNSALASVCKFCDAVKDTNLPNHLIYSKKCQERYYADYGVETLEELKGILKKIRKCTNQKRYYARKKYKKNQLN